MNRYSSSVHKSDWECSSKSVRGSFFVNPLYIKNLTNLTNLTTLQTLQPYRFLCRVPKGPHAYLCTLHKGRLPAQCGLHEICSFSSLLRAFQSNWEAQFWKRNPACLHGSRPVRNDGLEPCEPSKIKRTHRSRSFWLPRRRSQSIQRFTVTQSTAHSAGPAGGWHPGDAASRQRWTPRHRQTAGW